MKNDLTCNVVRDLLPSYVDGLTTEETNQAVEAHLTGCEQCTKEKERMSAPMQEEKVPASEINYLKKIKRSGQRTKMAIVLLAVMLLTGIVIYLPTMFSRTEPAESVDWAVVSNGESTMIQFSVYGRDIKYIETSESDDGLTGDVAVVTKGVPLFSFNQCDRQSIFIDDFVDFTPQRLTLNGTEVLMENGVGISRMANELFAFVSDKAADRKQEIQDYYEIPDDSNVSVQTELNTDEKGSVLSILVDVTTQPDTYYSPWSDEDVDETLTKDACYLLALLGDLNEVRFDYTIDSEAHTLTVTAADASAKLGRDVKSFSASLADVQALVTELDPEQMFLSLI